ncbi:MAG TPA: 2-amino-4-hydroxy-6-hydroxymethyldihydropteridine diphosphokinase [Leifsonia sp.]|nr:2-amino-4-hydroxy-6-hydroxymethyldihydropteridine diphosphokinase [Leifsonia sp.]
MQLPAVIALGSNLGDREQALRDAVAAIRALPGVTVTAASDIVESPAVKPAGVDASAPAYLNAVITVRSALPPDELLDALNEIERDLGRVRDIRWGDRTIDLDIITAGGTALRTERLTLPHPRAFERGFVLIPWLQIEPLAQLPGFGPVADLVRATTHLVRRFPATPLLEPVPR